MPLILPPPPPVGGVSCSNLTFSKGWKETVHNCRADGAVTEVLSKMLGRKEKPLYMDMNLPTPKNKEKYSRIVRVQILESDASV